MELQVNKERTRLWVNALRSGDFQQGVGALIQFNDVEENRHCCLGVGCEAAIDAGVRLRVEKTDGLFLLDGNSGSLPQAVQQWLSIDHENPLLHLPESARAGKSWTTAIACNDEYRMTFAEIADAIERTFLEEERQ